MGAVALTCLMLVTTSVPAQQPDALHVAYLALGAAKVTTLRLTGFGATYAITPAPSSSPREPLQSYDAEVDFVRPGMRVTLVRGTATERRPAEVLAQDAQQIWSTPQGFLSAAHASRATTRLVPYGTEVTFISGGRTYVGLINGRGEVDRVHTWVNNPVLGDILVETLFRDYEQTPAGVSFPMHITQSHAGRPSFDIWLSSVAVETRTKEARP